MITLDDCKAFCDVDAATVARVARQEGLPEILAIARVQGRLTRARRLPGNPPAAAMPAAATMQRLAA